MKLLKDTFPWTSLSQGKSNVLLILSTKQHIKTTVLEGKTLQFQGPFYGI